MLYNECLKKCNGAPQKNGPGWEVQELSWASLWAHSKQSPKGQERVGKEDGERLGPVVEGVSEARAESRAETGSKSPVNQAESLSNKRGETTGGVDSELP